MMSRRILILGDVHSSHLIKWANSLQEEGFEIHIFTLVRNREETKLNNGIKTFYSGFSSRLKTYDNEGSFKKLLFLAVLPRLLSIIRKIKPDLVHAHYASSYGLFGALTGFHPFFVSVWGSDIYSFPKRGKIHRSIIRFIFKKADVILSTSRNMGREVNLYTPKPVNVIPFGIDTDYFKPGSINRRFSKDELIIGTIKNLEDFYGIDILIRIFSQLKKNNPYKKLRLMICGSGAKEKELKELVNTLKITEYVLFTGRIEYSDVVNYHNMINIFANLSLDESFGVSVLEASACGVPVIASTAGGLPEVVQDGVTGYSLSLSDEELIEKKFQELIDDPERRSVMGKNGRQFVCSNYEWKTCVKKMSSFYLESLNEIPV